MPMLHQCPEKRHGSFLPFSRAFEFTEYSYPLISVTSEVDRVPVNYLYELHLNGHTFVSIIVKRICPEVAQGATFQLISSCGSCYLDRCFARLFQQPSPTSGPLINFQKSIFAMGYSRRVNQNRTTIALQRCIRELQLIFWELVLFKMSSFFSVRFLLLFFICIYNFHVLPRV